MWRLERLAFRTGHRQAADRHCLAPERLSTLLAVENPARPVRSANISKDVRQLIRTMSRENPLWGAPRLHGELLKLGIDVGQTSVAKYIVRIRKPPSQT